MSRPHNPTRAMKTYIPVARAVLAGALAASAAACDNGLTELNENPNQPTLVSPEYLHREIVGFEKDIAKRMAWWAELREKAANENRKEEDDA